MRSSHSMPMAALMVRFLRRNTFTAAFRAFKLIPNSRCHQHHHHSSGYTYTSRLLPLSCYAISVFGFYKSIKDTESDETKLPLSFKRCYFKAETAVDNGDYTLAESEYHKALEILQDDRDNVNTEKYMEAMAVIVYKLGELYLIKKEWEKASKNYIETINLMLKCNVPLESPQITDLSLKLGKVFTNMSNYEEARKTLVFALSSATKLVEEDRSKENLALLGMCHHVLGQYYLMLMDYQQALNCLKESLDISKEVYDESDDVQQVTVLMSDVSTSLDLLGRHDEATDMLEEAIGLLSSSQSPVDNEHMAILLMNLAAVTNNKGKTSEAVEVYMKADSYALTLSDKSLHNEIKRRLRLL